MNNIFEIPDDIFLYIFKYLDLYDIKIFHESLLEHQKENLINLLNKYKFNYGYMNILYNIPCTSSELNFFKSNKIKFQLNELNISLSNDKLPSIIYSLTKITKLILDNSLFLKEDIIFLLSKNIISLSIKNCNITEDIFDVIEEKCFELEELIMSINFCISSKKIINIFNKCSKLKFIQLNLFEINDDLKKNKIIKSNEYITIYRENIMKIK